jgi:hypothetical protein
MSAIKYSDDFPFKCEDEEPEPVYKHFSWFRNPSKDRQERLLGDMRDFGHGLEELLQIIEHDASQGGSAPLFSQLTQGRLLRLAIACTRMIGDRAESDIDRLNNLK